MDLLYILLGALIGSVIIYFWLSPKVKSTIQLDTETQLKNNQLKQTNQALCLANEKLVAESSELVQEQTKLEAHRDELQNSIETLSKTAKTQAQEFYNTELALAKERLEKSLLPIEKNFECAKEDYKNDYLKVNQECAEEFAKEISKKTTEIHKLLQQMNDLQSKVNASVEANKRAVEIAEQANFYKLTLSDEDIEEIQKLRSVLPYLRDAEPLNKVIWKVYYEKPYTDLVGRVVGQGTHCGIYKITNLENQMCYVGQAVNIADRWKQHIKRGVGAETPTRNKLYPAMLAIGVENFSFEIIEECDRSKLNEREDYWQDYFHAKDFGYSIK